MRNKPWSPKEILFLKENYPSKGKLYCSEHLNREGSSIFKKANRLNLKINPDVKLINNTTAQNKYQSNRISDDFNVSIEQFLDIQKPEVAYLLGFLWADGYIVRNEIRLEIVKDDLDHIKPILESIGTWTYSYRNRSRNGVKTKTSGRAVTSNRKLKEFLACHDYDKKSYVSADKILSKIPNELKHYFFRGFVDGDGNIYPPKKRITLAGSLKQDWGFISKICDELKIKHNIYRHSNKSTNSVVEINGINGLIFGNYIFKGNEFGLERKSDKFNKFKKDE
jgi:hypothetical protein